jgi:alkylhydroperoxidase/carboxymuconolactone decarboxylase family protein YurZ
MAKPSEHNENFRRDYPQIWSAFSKLAEQCHDGGPLDDKTRRLIKVALSLGAGLEGATHSAVRHARDTGITEKEIEHVAVLAITTLGFPSAMRALSWLHDDKSK